MTIIQCRATIGGKPIYDAPKGDAQSNWFEMGQGAYPGAGRVLVRASDWTVLTDDSALRLKIWTREDAGAWPSNPVLDLPVRVQAALPFLQPRKSTGTDGAFVELHLHDGRFEQAFASYLNQSFNVQKAGFPYDGSDPSFYPATLSGGSEYGWAAVASAVGLTATGYTFPTVKPRNIVLSGCSRAEAMERVARILHARIAFDWSAGTLTLIANGASTPDNEALWTEFVKNPISSALAKLNDRRYPASLRFLFRVANAGADPYAAASRWYERTLPTGYGPAGTVRALDVGYWFGRDGGGSITNATELNAVAAFLLAANVLDRHETVGDVRNAGIVPFKPDGKFRRVLWTFDAHELTTTVRVNSDLPIRPAARGPADADRAGWLVEPAADAFTARTIDGRTQVAPLGDAGDEFDAIITGNVEVADNRWRYAWQSAVLSGDVYVRQTPPDRSGTTAQDWAINGNETGNTATYKAMGLRLDGPSFPSGMSVIPIGGDFEGFLHDVHVRMRRTTDEAGNVRYAFNAPNEVDGPC